MAENDRWTSLISPADLFVIIPNFNGLVRGHLEGCLSSIAKSRVDGFSASAVVVDDGSEDGSRSAIRKYVSQDTPGDIRFHGLQTRGGLEVTGSLNFVIERIMNSFPRARYIAIFDADTQIESDFLSVIVRRAENSEPKAGMFAGNQFFLTNGTRSSLPRSKGHYVTGTGATMDIDFKGKAMNKGRPPLCMCLSGCLLKVPMLRELGLILPEYRHYYNCPELGFRARLEGWGVETVTSAKMWHASLPPKRTESVDVPRLWNIYRFFPLDRIQPAIKAYLEEDTERGPTRKARLSYVKLAKETCPPVYPCSSALKERLFRCLKLE